jgi:hypothetical protein
MTQPASRIIKNGQMEIEGRMTIDLGNFPPSAGQAAKGAPAAPAKVRILENQDQYAVMEVTCSCGKKTIIRCDYGDLAAAKNAEQRAQAAGPANQKKT